MRGFVMILMVVDHASMAFNVRHAALDPTLISLLKGQLTFQVLFAIGMGMVLMAW